MWVLGAVMAVTAGLGYNAAAAIEKREALVVGRDVPVFRLLPALARRKWWLFATAIGLAAWLAQVVALTLAPIAAVIPLIAAGTALLLFLGIRWLGERFSAAQLVAVGVVVAGAVVAALSAGSGITSRAALSPVTQVVLAALALGAALPFAVRRTGFGYGIAAGFLYAATAVFSKEVGDRFAVHGWSAVRILAASPTPWALIMLAVLAQTFVQAGLQRGNAASVTTAMSAVDTIGPILAGFFLYHQPFPEGFAGAVLLGGIGAAVIGSGFLSATLRWEMAAEQDPPDASAARPSPVVC